MIGESEKIETAHKNHIFSVMETVSCTTRSYVWDEFPQSVLNYSKIKPQDKSKGGVFVAADDRMSLVRHSSECFQKANKITDVIESL